MLTRRELLRMGGATLLLLHLNHLALGQDSEEVFPQGVASGDPTQRGVVLWTRVNPVVHRRKEKDLLLQLSEDLQFREASTVRIPAHAITPEKDFTIRIDLEGRLKPGRTYYYRFVYEDVRSMVGRFHTLPERARELTLGFVVCQNYPDGYYTAYRHLAQEELQFVVHLGDFIYEKIYGPPRVPGRGIQLPSNEKVCINLEDYRHLYRTYLSDQDLKLARAMHPFVNTWDDHEFLNDYYYDYQRGVWGYFVEGHPVGEDRLRILRLRQDAIRAWFEYVPARVTLDLNNPNPLKWITLYRDFDLGGLAHLIVLDERSYRERPPCTGRFGVEGCPEQKKTSMLGKEQLSWFSRKLLEGEYGWKVVANSVQFSRSLVDGKFGSLDAWEGYAGERQALLDLLRHHRKRNLLLLSGDRHAAMVAEVPDSYDKPSEVLGAEFVTPALSSINALEGGWWRKNWPQYATLEEYERAEVSQNPWIKYLNMRTWGYSLIKLTPRRAEATLVSVNKYSKDARREVMARFEYAEGKLERASISMDVYSTL
ncbi:MAG: alkaline phosphatase D family protein [Aquificaceae bacterium]|nr:alkaline phosphatase D family protein [Aquificaceae bacterium]